MATRNPLVVVNGQMRELPTGDTLTNTDPAGTAASLLSSHTSASDPHPQYLTPSEADAAYEPKNSNIQAHISSTSNPHAVTAAQVGAIPMSQKGAANGVATLDASGYVPVSQMPPATITDTYPVASQAEMLALVCQKGDVAVRTDLNKSFILRVEPASVLANWQELLTPTDAVQSVGGYTGTVTAGQILSAVETVDGAGSGLDADLLDGQQGSYYAPEDATTIGTILHGVIEKSTPVDTDEVPLSDSTASFALKKLTLANLKAAIKSYYDSAVSTLTNKTLTGGLVTTTSADNNATLLISDNKWVKSQIASQANPASISQAIEITYVASGSNGIAVADSSDINFGTGNFTIHWEGSLPDWTPSNSQVLLSKGNTSTGYLLQVDLITGVLRLFLNGVQYASTVAPSFVDGTLHKITIVVTRESASANGSIVFYTDGVQLGSSVVIPAGVPATIDVSIAFYILGSSATRYAGRVKSVILYNRALTAVDVLDAARNGVAYSDKWGKQTAQYTSNFSVGVDSWSAYNNCTIAGNVDGIAGLDNWLQITATGINPVPRRTTPTKPCIQPYKRARITLTYYAASGSATTVRIRNQTTTASDVFGEFPVVYGSVQTVTCEVEENLGLYGITVQFIGGVSGDIYYMRDFVSYPCGAVLSLEPENIQPAPGQWLDSSGNGNHAMQPATGTSLVRPQRAGEVRWTNTWAGTSETQYVGGVNQNILPSSNIRIESITMRSSATGVNVTLGNGVVADYWVTSVALVSYLDIANPNNRNHDGTNRKITITPSANFTGSITTTIMYTIID